MDYLKIYKQLVIKRQKEPSTESYIQKHHILPRSINPSLTKCKNNIVILSAREHFIAHALLVKITEKSQNKENYYKMLFAFNNMNRNANNQRYINSHLYQLFKIRIIDRIKYISKQRIKQFNPSKDKIWITNLDLKQSKLINKNDQIPEGWLKGKLSKTYIEHYNDALTEQRYHHFINYQEDIQNGVLPRILYNKKNYVNRKQKEINKQERVKLAKQYFNYYKQYGFQEFVKQFNYTSSQAALCQFLKLWIPDQFIQLKNHKITIF